MNIPPVVEGFFDDAALLDGCGYRTLDGVVDFSSDRGKLGLVRQMEGYVRAEFLSKQVSAVFSYPIWEESRDRVFCASVAEAKEMIVAFVGENDSEDG